MVIEKYTKDKGNKYIVVIDNEKYSLYDDIIIKYELLRKKEISKELLDEILRKNEEMISYFDAVKYINKKMRAEDEIIEYLKKKNISAKIIDSTVIKLKENHLLNDELYVKSFINDQINLTNHGPLKIKACLLKYNIDESLIDEYLNKISTTDWEVRIKNYLDKKIKVNKNSSEYMLKVKLQNDLINLGYDKEICHNIISKITFDDKDIQRKEYDKIKKSLEKKYTGIELERKIKEKMYRKGFKIYDMED